MKKNEAISILATSARPREPKNRTRYDEAVKMAIEALRQPERRSFSCGQENDAISRQAALDAVSYETFECYQARKDIRALPSTDRKGHWIQKDYYDMDWNVYECDQCGKPWQLEAGTPKDNNMNYCPRCGADMRGKE